ncbi:HAMP domain-containing sensor histidine kinase [Sphingomonas sp. CROZ-RG-20F-R02-07]|uniref:PAS domain-containing sensor histidine kinase n=1 Tax=Sphingomonas sp. CROZ-RG-20F-R02-07 TaxID=2914832 RepID=UPI001F58E1F2|nr:HAMP domain-containing sensor histidine kinase [Sphingomonas sp. CROZ-RG-20F-R02-07]
MSETGDPPVPALPVEHFADLYDDAPCGYLSMLDDGRIFKVNATLATWTGFSHAELTGKRLADLLTVGTRIFFETHGAPMLRLQGRIEELALELKARTGERIPVFAHGVEHVGSSGRPHYRLVLVKAGQRRRWEHELVEARRASETLLAAAVDTAELREQFIAVLGHDLRNPVASIEAGMRLLRRRERLGPDGFRVVELVEGSVARMSALIDDVLDFARGRLGGGAPLDVRRQVAIAPLLAQVAEELRLSSPHRVIDVRFGTMLPVDCDPSRLGQLASNLLGNALTHGAKDAPVSLSATTADDVLTISVANAGTAIPPDAMARLFQPFVRGEVRASQEGLGLGLYIASEIAKAHGGALGVTSSDEETRFTFSMPLASTANEDTMPPA